MQLLTYLPTAIVALGTVIGLLSMTLGVISTIGRMLPSAWVLYVERNIPRLAWGFRAARKFGNDAIPVLQAVYKMLAGHPYEPVAPAPARPSVPPMLVLLALALAGCSSSQVHTQALVATGASDGFNRAQGVVLVAFEQQSEAAAQAVCCDRARMLEAADVVDRRWRPVLASWELARVAHDRWRVDLMICQQTVADGGACAIDLAAEERAFLAAATDARCSVIVLDVADPLASLGAPACASSSPPPSLSGGAS